MIDVDCHIDLGKSAKTVIVVLVGAGLLGIALWESVHAKNSLLGQELARFLSDDQLIDWCSTRRGWNCPAITDELAHRAFLDESLARRILTHSGPESWINQFVAVRLAKELVLIRQSPAALGYLRFLADRELKHESECQSFVGRVDRGRKPQGLRNKRACEVLCATVDIPHGTVIRRSTGYPFQIQEMTVASMDRFDYVDASSDLTDYLVVEDLAAGKPVLATQFTSLSSTCGGSGAHLPDYRRLPKSIAEAASQY